ENGERAGHDGEAVRVGDYCIEKQEVEEDVCVSFASVHQ
ncbi:hypothetical protein A2U01_0039944, partial [Trifolium medium]|nr:hypothetical protein [Trifolium medium]